MPCIRDQNCNSKVIQTLRAFRRAGYVTLPSTKERTDRLPDMSVSLVGALTSTISRPAPRGLEQGIVLNFWPNFCEVNHGFTSMTQLFILKLLPEMKEM